MALNPDGRKKGKGNKVHLHISYSSDSDSDSDDEDEDSDDLGHIQTERRHNNGTDNDNNNSTSNNIKTEHATALDEPAPDHAPSAMALDAAPINNTEHAKPQVQQVKGIVKRKEEGDHDNDEKRHVDNNRSNNNNNNNNNSIPESQQQLKDDNDDDNDSSSVLLVRIKNEDVHNTTNNNNNSAAVKLEPPGQDNNDNDNDTEDTSSDDDDDDCSMESACSKNNHNSTSAREVKFAPALLLGVEASQKMEVTVNAQEAAAITTKRKPERPRTNNLPTLSFAVPLPLADAVLSKKKRGPGRPRKNPPPEETDAALTPKKKVGRPRKNPLPEDTTQPGEAAAPTPAKKRGRPRKKLPEETEEQADAEAAAAEPPKKKRGRPRKQPATSSSSTSTTQVVVAPPPPPAAAAKKQPSLVEWLEYPDEYLLDDAAVASSNWNAVKRASQSAATIPTGTLAATTIAKRNNNTSVVVLETTTDNDDSNNDRLEDTTNWDAVQASTLCRAIASECQRLQQLQGEGNELVQRFLVLPTVFFGPDKFERECWMPFWKYVQRNVYTVHPMVKNGLFDLKRHYERQYKKDSSSSEESILSLANDESRCCCDCHCCGLVMHGLSQPHQTYKFVLQCRKNMMDDALDFMQEKAHDWFLRTITTQLLEDRTKIAMDVLFPIQALLDGWKDDGDGPLEEVTGLSASSSLSQSQCLWIDPSRLFGNDNDDGRHHQDLRDFLTSLFGDDILKSKDFLAIIVGIDFQQLSTKKQWEKAREALAVASKTNPNVTVTIFMSPRTRVLDIDRKFVVGEMRQEEKPAPDDEVSANNSVQFGMKGTTTMNGEYEQDPSLPKGSDDDDDDDDDDEDDEEDVPPPPIISHSARPASPTIAALSPARRVLPVSFVGVPGDETDTIISEVTGYSSATTNRGGSEKARRRALAGNGKHAYEHFKDKFGPVYKIEFEDSEIGFYPTISQMWSRHKMFHGSNCEAGCNCVLDLPLLTETVVGEYLRKKSLEGNPGWRIPPGLANEEPPVGFVNNFFPKFLPLVHAKFPDEDGSQTLKRLVAMWGLHKQQRAFGSVCLKSCTCEEGWSYVFRCGDVFRTHTKTNRKPQRQLSVPEARVPRKKRPRNEAAVGGALKGASDSVIPSASSKGSKIRKTDLAMSSNPEKSCLYSVKCDTSHPLGFYCVTGTISGKSSCVLTSVFPSGQSRQQSALIQEGTCVDSVEVLQGGAWVRYPVPGHDMLKQYYDHSSKESGLGLDLIVWFTNAHGNTALPRGSGGEGGSNEDWTKHGMWLGKVATGWAGGADTVTQLPQGLLRKHASSKPLFGSAITGRPVNPLGSDNAGRTTTRTIQQQSHYSVDLESYSAESRFHPPASNEAGSTTSRATQRRLHYPAGAVEVVPYAEPRFHPSAPPASNEVGSSTTTSIQLQSSSANLGSSGESRVQPQIQSSTSAVASRMQPPTRGRVVAVPPRSTASSIFKINLTRRSDPSRKVGFENGHHELFYVVGSKSYELITSCPDPVLEPAPPAHQATANESKRELDNEHNDELDESQALRDLIRAVRNNDRNGVLKLLRKGVLRTHTMVKDSKWLDAYKFAKDRNLISVRKPLSIYKNAHDVITTATSLRSWFQYEVRVEAIVGMKLTEIGRSHPESEQFEGQVTRYQSRCKPQLLAPLPPKYVPFSTKVEYEKAPYTLRFNGMQREDASILIDLQFTGSGKKFASVYVPLKDIHDQCGALGSTIERQFSDTGFFERGMKVRLIAKKVPVDPEFITLKRIEVRRLLQDIIEWIDRYHKEEENLLPSLTLKADIRGHANYQLLHAAIFLEQPSLVKELISRGADPEGTSDKGSAHTYALNLLYAAKERLRTLKGKNLRVEGDEDVPKQPLVEVPLQPLEDKLKVLEEIVCELQLHMSSGSPRRKWAESSSLGEMPNDGPEPDDTQLPAESAADATVQSGEPAEAIHLSVMPAQAHEHLVIPHQRHAVDKNTNPEDMQSTEAAQTNHLSGSHGNLVTPKRHVVVKNSSPEEGSPLDTSPEEESDLALFCDAVSVSLNPALNWAPEAKVAKFFYNRIGGKDNARLSSARTDAASRRLITITYLKTREGVLSNNRSLGLTADGLQLLVERGLQLPESKGAVTDNGSSPTFAGIQQASERQQNFQEPRHPHPHPHIFQAGSPSPDVLVKAESSAAPVATGTTRSTPHENGPVDDVSRFLSPVSSTSSSPPGSSSGGTHRPIGVTDETLMQIFLECVWSANGEWLENGPLCDVFYSRVGRKNKVEMNAVRGEATDRGLIVWGRRDKWSYGSPIVHASRAMKGDRYSFETFLKLTEVGTEFLNSTGRSRGGASNSMGMQARGTPDDDVGYQQNSNHHFNSNRGDSTRYKGNNVGDSTNYMGNNRHSPTDRRPPTHWSQRRHNH